MCYDTLKQTKNNLIWIDLEMTGLIVDKCHIIEIAAIVTDKNLNIIAESPAIAIYQSDDILKNMDPWCIKVHTESGLVKRVQKSEITVSGAEQLIMNFIKPYVNKGESPLCGNSIWQDRKFLSKYMPQLEKYFHYRLFDVSSFKVAASLWNPELLKQLNKKNNHLALDDIRDSIREMKFYHEYLLKLPK